MNKLILGMCAATALCTAGAEGTADETWSASRTVAESETVEVANLTVAGDGIAVTNAGAVNGTKLVLREGSYVQKSGTSKYAVSTVVGNGYDTAAARELTVESGAFSVPKRVIVGLGSSEKSVPRFVVSGGEVSIGSEDMATSDPRYLGLAISRRFSDNDPMGTMLDQWADTPVESIWTTGDFLMTGGEVSAANVSFGSSGECGKDFNNWGRFTLAGGVFTLGNRGFLLNSGWNKESGRYEVVLSGGTLAAYGNFTNTLATRLSNRDGGVTLRADAGKSMTFAAPLYGEGGFTKTGAGTLELPRAARTNTGATTVAQGTLKLVDDPRFSKSLAYWFDASREEDFEKDASGVITKWKARGGSAVSAFTAKAGSPTWGKTGKVNGHNVVSTRSVDGTADQLVADAKATHRTLFVVARVNSAVAMGGLIGDSGRDYGQRLNGDASQYETESGNWTIETRNAGGLRMDGAVKKDTAVDAGKPHILTLYHDRDDWATTLSWGGTSKTGSAELLPAIGWYKESARHFDGDYCEILCFDRVLSESETRLVENYLAEKWLGRTVHETVDPDGHLSAETTLHVAAGATLDLNGCPVTVAALEGSGTITNSSAVAATVTVTGKAAFDGVVGGPVTLSVAGDSAVGARFDAGATLVVAGGTVAAGTHVLAPPTNGLAYWCDAGRRETILLNASNCVTGWLSRVSSSARGLFSAGSQKPTYGESSMDGRPGVSFPAVEDANGVPTAVLKADKTSPVQTVFLALAASQTVNCAGYWGVYGVDRGFRAGNSAATVEGVPLTEEDVIVTRKPKAGLVVASAGPVVVGLETALTPELIAEGLAREFVSHVQSMRKEANFEVTQRITLAVEADADLRAALEAHADYVKNETLAVELAFGPVEAPALNLNGHAAKIAVKPVANA